MTFVVGVEGFELSTPCSQSRCANRTALHPELSVEKRSANIGYIGDEGKFEIKKTEKNSTHFVNDHPYITTTVNEFQGQNHIL